MTQTRVEHLGIRASAGTGKTFRLSNRFIELLLAGEEPSSILATTFTRKAAGEILDRVLKRLAEAAEDSKACQDLGKFVGQPNLGCVTAQAHLQRVVSRLHRLNIGTLDAFFMQVARLFGLELGLPARWSIVDDSVDKQMRLLAIRQLLDVSEDQRPYLHQMLRVLSKGDVPRAITDQLLDHVQQLHGLFLDTPKSAWHWMERQQVLDEPALTDAIAVLEKVQSPLNKSGSVNKTFEKALVKLVDSAGASRWRDLLNNTLVQRIMQGESIYARAEITDAMIGAIEPLMNHARGIVFNELKDQTERLFELLSHFDDYYRQLKIQRSAFGFSDITLFLFRLQLGNCLDDFYFRLDGQIQHLLLDEFQDTSLKQWSVIEPLATEMIDNVDGSRSFFCVGDVKQSIYGWRGGEAALFDHLEEKYRNKSLHWEPMDISHRSAEVIMKVVNQVFTDIDQCSALAKAERGAKLWAKGFSDHTTAKTEYRGEVYLMTATLAAEGEKQQPETLRYAAAKIKELAKAHPGRSIGVLVRKNAAVRRLIFELTRGDDAIAASEEGGNPLTDTPAVNVLLSLLQLADHPGDTACRFHVVCSPLAKVLGYHDYQSDAKAAELSEQVRGRLVHDGYGVTLRHWVDGLAQGCDASTLARLEQLVELGYAHDNQPSLRPSEFVALVASQRVESPSGAPVRVMTVHQSKGLQFDIVVLPELNDKLFGQSPQVLTLKGDDLAQPPTRVVRYASKDVLAYEPVLEQMYQQNLDLGVRDILSLLYVAMTRAIHCLYMIIDPSTASENSLPQQYAGILRERLVGSDPVEPDKVIWESELNDAGWDCQTTVDVGKSAPEVTGPLRLADSAKHVGRGLQRLTPSGLEGGREIRLSDRYRLQAGRSLQRGLVIHSWFEQVNWLDEPLPDDAELIQLGLDHGGDRLQIASWLDEFKAMCAQPVIRSLLSRSRWSDRSVQLYREHGFVVPVAAGELPGAHARHGVLEGVIDRLVLVLDEDRRVVAGEVVDYKTDAVGSDAALTAAIQRYQPQMRAYRFAVARRWSIAPSQVSVQLAFVGAGLVESV